MLPQELAQIVSRQTDVSGRSAEISSVACQCGFKIRLLEASKSPLPGFLVGEPQVDFIGSIGAELLFLTA